MTKSAATQSDTTTVGAQLIAPEASPEHGQKGGVSGWRECKLGDILHFGNGKTRPKHDGDIPVYGGNGVLGYANQSNYEGETNENRPIWVSDNALSAFPKSGYDTKYLYYFLKNMDLNSHAGGSSHPLVTQTLLNSLDVDICIEPSEQKAIAAVLSSLDDKIDLLYRQNQTLEAMAQTLFRQWFIEEAKEDWALNRMNDLAKVGIGRTPPRKEPQWFSTVASDVKWISIKDMGNDGVFIFNTSEFLTKEAIDKFNVPIIPKDTVVLSFKMTVGRVAITIEDMVSNEAIAYFKLDETTPISKEYLYLYLKNYQYEMLGSTSSIVTAINSTMIKEMDVLVPDQATMRNFAESVVPMFEKIKTNQQQIQTLTQLRDTLLPKLMSGEIRVEVEYE